jgi:hypothetical protein
MSQPPNTPFDPFAAFRDGYMDAWSKAMIDLVNSDAYQEASGAMLDAYLSVSQPFRKALEQAMAQTLAQLNMPSRADVTTLAERLTNIELRLDDLEAKIDGMKGK